MKKRKQIRQHFVCAFLLLVILAQTAVQAVTIEPTGAYLRSEVSAPVFGDEWTVLALARSGYTVPNSYYRSVTQTVQEKSGVLHKSKYTEYARVILALTSIGRDPRNVAGYDLLKPLSDFEKVTGQGVNGVIWALIALDCGDYPMPVDTNATVLATRQMYVDELLSRQCRNGGWSISGQGSADVDMTAMALQALARYQKQPTVKTAIDRAITALARLQSRDGSFSSGCEGTAQVLVALCALGIDPDDQRFVKNGHTLMDALFLYQQANGSFVHKIGDDQSSLIATEQACYALTAVQRANNGQNSLYQMGNPPGTGLPGKASAVSSRPVTVPGKTFSDISGHADQVPIEALASRGIIDGKENGRFDPNGKMTRAEFASIVVRALGLPGKTVSVFSDVRSDQWYAPYVGAAYTNGIVAGKSAARFEPNGTITRQEAAAMLTHAAALCGMDTELNSTAVNRILEGYTDKKQIAAWAAPSVAFCHLTDISSMSDRQFSPSKAITRCEVARMLYCLLQNTNLM